MCPLDVFQYLVPESNPAECELRDVIFSFVMALFLRESVWVFLVVIRADIGFGIFCFQYRECY